TGKLGNMDNTSSSGPSKGGFSIFGWMTGMSPRSPFLNVDPIYFTHVKPVEISSRLSETKDMAWSKPRNVQLLNLVTRQGATWANTLGSLALFYSVFGVAIKKAQGAEDDINTVAAGTMTGMLYKGVRGAARGGLMLLQRLNAVLLK
uniref:Translocase of inner mitochondrial membrane 23 homolog b (yeast) n=1 Tax=Hucho hucho TaxID=62062 RepID=A0A4W5P7C3_9TELE